MNYAHNAPTSTSIKDSGSRRIFDSGAVRDIEEGKGRCDLMPLGIIASLMDTQFKSNILYHLHLYMQKGHTEDLYKVLYIFSGLREWTIPQMLLEVSIHYEQGCNKYGERNWEKGIPLHAYIDSALRHYLKFLDGRKDERHDRAFVWNILGALWTHANMPELIDLPFDECSCEERCADDPCDCETNPSQSL